MSAGRKLPHGAAPFVFGALTSGFMSLLVSTVATWRALGSTPDFVAHAISAWLSAWPIAFLALLTVAPAVRRIVAVVVAPPPNAPTAS